MRKVLKYAFRTLLVLLSLPLICIVLLYVPTVQEFALHKAVGPVSKALGMELSVGGLRLAFPLRLTVEQVRLIDRSDTLVDCGRIRLDVDPGPLLRKKAVVRTFGIERLAACYRDSVTGFGMRLTAGRLDVERVAADLRTREAAVGRIALDDAGAFLRPGSSESVEKPDTAPAQPWTIDLAAIAIRNTSFEMETAPDIRGLSVQVGEAGADTCRVELGGQQVSVARFRLDRSACTYLTLPKEEGLGLGPTAPEVQSGTEQPAQPWEIRIGAVALTEDQVTYGVWGHHPTAGFDPEYIQISGLELSLDSLRNRGSDIALQIRQLAFKERCGLSVEQTRGRFEMGPEGIALTGFDLTTRNSHIRADVKTGPGILQTNPAAPLTADAEADVNTAELALLAPSLLPAPLDNRPLRLHLAANGTLEELARIGLELSSPGHLALTVDGTAKYPLDPQRIAASARFRGDLRDPAFLLEILPDTALRRRVALPERIGLQGTAAADRGAYALTSLLTAGGGRIGLEGRFDSRRQQYAAELRCDSFPLNRFLPHDSLGRLDLALDAQGEGFDPFSAATRSRIRLEISHAEYRGRDFGGIGVEADLAEQRLAGRIEDRDSALRIVLGIDGRMSREQQQVRVSGQVGWFDLAALGFLTEPIGGLFLLDAEASAAGPGCYDARIALDSIAVRNGAQTDRIRPTTLEVRTDSTSVRAEVQSGDLRWTFRAPESLDSLRAALPRSLATLMRQIDTQCVDMDSLKPALPDFRMELSAGQENILNNFLRTKNASFRRLELHGGNADSLPTALTLHVEGLTSGGIRIDTTELSLRQDGPRLQYALRAANAPGNLDHIAAAALYGDVVQNTARLFLSQRDRSGRVGLCSEIDAAWTDSLVRISLGEDPRFGFEPWSVNPGNYLVYRFDKRLSADLDLTRGPQRFAIHSQPAEAGMEGIRVGMAGLGIGSILGLLPAAPPIDGVLGSDLVLHMGADTLALRGEVAVDSLTYDRQRFGDVALAARYAQGAGRQQADMRLTLDSLDVLSARADYRKEAANPLDAALLIPGFPLQRANVFLPDDLVQLSGVLAGRIDITGSPAQPLLDGGLRFAAASVRVPMIGTAFRFAEDTIRLDRSRVRFDRYALLAPNRKPLTIDGEVDLSDFSRMSADLTLRAADFQLVNVPRKERTTVYGEAYLDLNTSVKGPVDELSIRGNVALLGGTDINYVMQSSPLEVKQQSQNVVSFVSFEELDTQEPPADLPPIRIGGLDMALNVDINNDVKAAVDLSPDGSNRIDLRGGGNLSYTMNPLGDTRLAGKYVLSGGTVRYNPPVIAQKVFKIQPGSYVEWNGNPADPAFNITAVESVRANVSSDDGQETRPVNFDISINIRNTLTDLAISFGLAAPEDLTMQNQLNSLTAEQRANQAMNLLIYNTYTGPGTTAKVSSENPLNTFIQNELNQWAQNNLKGVDLSFGIDSYGQDDPNGQRTDYSYRLSKNLFSNRIRAVIGGKFSTDADPTQNLKENLIDDISIEYMLDKRDNMYIRVFRHTGYESILEGEITETGVGFVIRKRLSRLGDLFRSSKPAAKPKQQHEDDAH